VAASAAERQRLSVTARRFTEEDLTRYLQLTLDLFHDLQFSLQPRFHLEIGLMRMVQAGRLLPIEQALAQVSSGALPPAQPGNPPPPHNPKPPVSAAPSRNPQRAEPPPRQATPIDGPAGDPRALLHAYLHEKGMPHLADAVENASLAVSGGDLMVTAPKSYELYFRDRGFETAVGAVFGRPMRLKLTTADAPEATAPLAAPATTEDAATERALSHPEVQRFREVFDGKIYKVRNLKE